MDFKGKVKRISISLPPELLQVFDELVRNLGYERSRAVQIAMRNFIASHYWVKDERSVVGALLIIYDHEIKGIVDKIINIQHEFSNLITSSMHIHLDERRSLEVIIVKGATNNVKKLLKGITGINGIINITVNVIAA